MNKKRKKVLIYGAGEGGYMLIKEMHQKQDSKFIPVALIDDDPKKIGQDIEGVKVLGTREDVEKICELIGIEMILIAIPSIDAEMRKEIINKCQDTNLPIKIVPGFYKLIEEVTLGSMRNVDIKDLLGREEVQLEKEGIKEYIENKVVLVTGGGGSIGSELCRQIAQFNPKQLIILDIYENNAYELQNELKRKYPNLNQDTLIASVRNKRRLESIFFDYKPNVVFHAAAHKHVPLMEFNPSEAIKNNVIGTLNTVECADKYNVEKFVLISTDKAVNPTNVMGATKRICEMIVQAIQRESKTQFSAVRFRNVLGSNGSVIPLFKQQIEKGGPVTVTHREMTRYFMLIPEAAQLVLQAGAFAKGGEIFVLDMGESVKIYDLAENLIRLSGLEPMIDIDIQIVGLRPGEKLYEELLMSDEDLYKTEHNKIFIEKPGDFNINILKRESLELEKLAEIFDTNAIKRKLCNIVSTYKIDNFTNCI